MVMELLRAGRRASKGGAAAAAAAATGGSPAPHPPPKKKLPTAAVGSLLVRHPGAAGAQRRHTVSLVDFADQVGTNKRYCRFSMFT